MAGNDLNIKLIEDEVGLYILGFIDKDRFLEKLNQKLISLGEDPIDMIPLRLERLLKLLPKALDYTLDILEAELE
jgi:hypothetical protein